MSRWKSAHPPTSAGGGTSAVARTSRCVSPDATTSAGRRCAAMSEAACSSRSRSTTRAARASWCARPRPCPSSRRLLPPHASPGAATGWRPKRRGVHAAARDHPRDHGVRVPHLASAELVAPPDRRRNLGERTSSTHLAWAGICPGSAAAGCQRPSATSGMCSATPDADLVAETSGTAPPNEHRRHLRTHDALASRRSSPRHRRLLDDEPVSVLSVGFGRARAVQVAG